MYTYFWDIETSTITCDNGERMQVTYLSNVIQMNIENGDIVKSTFFRTIEETITYFKSLEKCTVWCHNLDYELTFLLRELGEVNATVRRDKNGLENTDIYNNTTHDIILRDKHAPITINLETIENITFRDSYCLFNKSVAKLGDEINLPKLEYNYKVVRMPWDKLEQLDYDYNERDNIIVARSIYKYMRENDFKFNEIPLTFTSFVKTKRKQFIKENYGKKGHMKFLFDRNEQLQDFNFFELSLMTYQGGLTASNILETGKFIDKGVYSIDAKSMYPFQMCTKHFPFYSYKNTVSYTGTLANEYYREGSFKGFIGTFKFTNIRVKNRNYLLPISSSQLSKGSVSEDKVLFNGKLLSSSEIIIPCNDIDIDTINLIYNYDDIECLEIFATNKTRRLRIEEVSFLLKAFLTKEKVTDKEDLEYILSKVYINSMYGVKVTTPIKSSFSIHEGEIENIDYFSFNIEERKEIYENFLNERNEFGGTLDIFTDGVYITSFSRYKLVKMMKELVDLGCNVVYSDTDSIKFYLNGVSENDVMKFIDDENEEIKYFNRKNTRFKTFYDTFHLSNNDFNIICNLGIWELETVDKKNKPLPLKLFVTYGAKKYGYITGEGKVKTTIAGCNRFKPSIAISNLARREKIDIEESFKFVMNVGTVFDESASGRTTAYQEKRTREEMYNLTYQGRKINQYGGIIIDETTYTLGMSINDTKLLGVQCGEEQLVKINIEGEVDFNE